MRFDELDDAEVEARTQARVLTRLLDPAFGFFVWALHFLALYVTYAVACQLGLGSAAGARSGMGMVIALAAVTLAAAGVVLAHAVKRYRQRGRFAITDFSFGSPSATTPSRRWRSSGSFSSLPGAGMPLALLHAPELVPPDRLWSSWSLEPFVLVALVASSSLYVRGVLRLWGSAGWGAGVPSASVASFAAGELALAVALVSPLDALGGALLSAHMAQHGILAGIAPPLLLLGRPGVAFAWGLSPALKHWRAAATVWRGLGRIARALSSPLRATVLHGLMVWAWHAPAPFNAAVEHEGDHALQHLCFFAPALLFWRALLGGAAERRTAAALATAFVTFMHTGLLGGLVTMAPEPLYAAYLGHTELWGLTALADQQLAGLLMWVPMGLPYLAAGLVLASRLVRTDLDDLGFDHHGMR